MASGSEVVVITGLDTTEICSGWVSLFPAKSCTLAVNCEVPLVSGIPDIAPRGLRISPPGNVPADTDQTNGGVPPVAERLC